MGLTFDQTSQTLTFLFTDLESSTQLWEQHPQAMKPALERHDAILSKAVEGSNGEVVKTTGDGLMAVFASAWDGLRACSAAQQALSAEPWGETGPLRVRMGLHAGEAQRRAGDYFGPALNRTARLMAAAHGGQVLLSAAAANLVIDQMPPGAELRDLGEHRLKDLERPEHIFQLVIPGLAADFPPLKTLDLRPNNLPVPPTPLIGREAELAEIVERLSSAGVRLLTVTGPGGMGKTRLSIQAAAELSDQFADGVFFVDLAPIREPDSVPVAIAQALGLRMTSDRSPLDELKEQLRAKTMVLLLDNFEQVTEAANLVAELIRACPQLKVLVTSREALRVRGEYVFPLAPLALPERDFNRLSLEQITGYESMRLFIERAQAVRPDFEVTEENAAVVAEICAKVDGLPLAIELAAARIRLFSPQALLERLGNRLNMLRGGARDLPARQQALRSAIEWSYDLLDTGEQRLFSMLAAFQGCTIEAAEKVAGRVNGWMGSEMDIFDGLASLADKSLVRQVERISGDTRFVMLETIREYAGEQLEENAEFQAIVQREHAAYYAEFTRLQWERLTGRRRDEALDELSADIENVQIAWSYWVEKKDLEQLGKFVDSLWLLCDGRGWYHALVDLATDLLNVLSFTPSTPELAQQEVVLRTSLARALLATKGYTPEVEEAYNRALEISQPGGEAIQIFPVLRGLFSFYTLQGRFDKGIPIGKQILDLAERFDDGNMRVDGYFILGCCYAFIGDTTRGLEYLQRGIAHIDPERHRLSRFTMGNYPGVPCYTASALIKWTLGYPDQAMQEADEAVKLAKKINHPYSLAYALYHSGFLRYWRRETELVLERTEELLKVAEAYKFQIWYAVGSCLQGAGIAHLGRAEAGLAQIQLGMDIYQGLKSPPIFWPLLRELQAEVCGLAGKPEQGLTVINEALAIPSPGYGGVLAVEFYRTKGDLLLALSPEKANEAEAWYRQAVEISRGQEAAMTELRAAIRLARLRPDHETLEILGETYAKFTEGFETPDLREARELLGQA